MKTLIKVLAVLTLVVSTLAVVKMGSAQSAQKQPNVRLSSPPEDVKGGSPADERLPGINPLPLEPTLAPGSKWERGQSDNAADPIQAVDAFVAKSRKETDESIRAMNGEAHALRARLAKVEAALQRWQAISGALPQNHPAPSLDAPVTEPATVDPGPKLVEPPGADPVPLMILKGDTAGSPPLPEIPKS